MEAHFKFLVVKQRVLVLHADKLGPGSHSSRLRGRISSTASSLRRLVTHFATLHEAVEGFHCFFGGDVGVMSMDLEEINVRGLQTVSIALKMAARESPH